MIYIPTMLLQFPVVRRALRRPFDDAQLAKMMAVARKGIESLIARQQAVLAGLPLRQ